MPLELEHASSIGKGSLIIGRGVSLITQKERRGRCSKLKFPWWSKISDALVLWDQEIRLTGNASFDILLKTKSKTPMYGKRVATIKGDFGINLCSDY